MPTVMSRPHYQAAHHSSGARGVGGGASGAGGSDHTVFWITLAVGAVSIVYYLFRRRAAKRNNNNNNTNANNNISSITTTTTTATARDGSSVSPARAGSTSSTTATTTSTSTISSPSEILRDHKYNSTWTIAVDFDALTETAATIDRSSAPVSTGSISLNSGGDNTTLSAAGQQLLEALLASRCRLILYCQVPPRDSSGSGKRATLAALAPFASRGLIRANVLFCETEKAHESFTRQIIPTLLVSARPATVRLVAKHISYAVLISPASSSSSGSFSNVNNVYVSPSMEAALQPKA